MKTKAFSIIFLITSLGGIIAAQEISFTVSCRIAAVLPKGQQLPEGGFLATILRVSDWRKPSDIPLPNENQLIVVRGSPRLHSIADGDVLKVRIRPESIVTATTGERVRSYSFLQELDANEGIIKLPSQE